MGSGDPTEALGRTRLPQAHSMGVTVGCPGEGGFTEDVHNG